MADRGAPRLMRGPGARPWLAGPALLLVGLFAVAVAGVLAAGMPAVAWAQEDGRVATRVQVGYAAVLRPESQRPAVRESAIKTTTWYPVRVWLSNHFVQAREVRLTLRRPLGAGAKDAVLLTQSVALSPRPAQGSPPAQMVTFLMPPVEGLEDPSDPMMVLTVESPEGETLLSYSTRHIDPRTKRPFVRWHSQDHIRLGGIDDTPPESKGAFFVELGVLRRDDRIVLQVGGTAPLPLPDPRQEDRTRLQLSRTTIAALPADWLAYEMLDAVVLVNPSWSALKARPRLWEALQRFVFLGGTLWLVMSEGAEAFTRSPLPGFAGLTLGSASTYASLGGHTFAPPLAGLSLLPADEGAKRRAPGVTRRYVGLGAVTAFGFDPTSARGSVSQALAGMLQDEFHRSRRDPGRDAAPVAPDAPIFDTRQVNALLVGYEALRRYKSAKPVGFLAIALFIGAYVLVIGPIDFFVLKKLDKLTWTWLTFTVSVFAFFLFAQYGSERLKGGEMKTNQITVLDFGAGDHFRGTALASFFSQSNEAYALWIPEASFGGLTRVAPSLTGSETQDPETARRAAETAIDPVRINQGVDETRGVQHYVTALRMPIWHIRSLYATWYGTRADHLTATRAFGRIQGRAGANPPLLRLTNGFPFDISWLVVLAGARRIVDRRPLPAGESRDLPLTGRLAPDDGVELQQYERDGEGAIVPTALPKQAFDAAVWIGGQRPRIRMDEWTGYGEEVEPRPPADPGPPLDDAPFVDPLTRWALGLSTWRNQQYLMSPPGVGDRRAAGSSDGSDDGMGGSSVDDESGFTGVYRTLEYQALDGLDLSPALAAGAIVVLGWSATPTYPLQVKGWSPEFERKGTLVRLVVRP